MEVNPNLEEEKGQISSDYDLFEFENDNDEPQNSKEQKFNEQEQYYDNDQLLKDSSQQQQDKLIAQNQECDQILDEEQQQLNQKHKQIYSKSNYRINLNDSQKTLFKNSIGQNRIIYLPTGAGKTLIAIACMFHYLSKGTNKKIIFLANTIQLVKQQTEQIRRKLVKIIKNKELSKELRLNLGENYLNMSDWTEGEISSKICCIHGQKVYYTGETQKNRIERTLNIKKESLKKIESSKIIVMISQMFLNYLRRAYLKLQDFMFVVFDECHHCKGSHPYAQIMSEFYFEQKRKNNKKLPYLMGLTASPILQAPKNHDYSKLSNQLLELCQSLNSYYTHYTVHQTIDKKSIEVVKIEDKQANILHPDLIKHFKIYHDHQQSYEKIKYHFPKYFECVKQIIDFLSQFQGLELHSKTHEIHIRQMIIFYDVKQCLLIKIRDLWLQLGNYAFLIAFCDLISELNRIQGMDSKGIKILKQVIKILEKYQKQYIKLYDKCDFDNFSSKVVKLIELLGQRANLKIQQNQDKSKDMVIVFAAERRTVAYLAKILNQYKNDQPQQRQTYYSCQGVTGYSAKKNIQRNTDGHTYETDPSSKQYENKIVQYAKEFMNTLRDQKQSLSGQNKNLRNQMRRIQHKHGKLLLQIQQKYTHQIQKIINFKKKNFRVLITTSVTEQGFNIPGCNIVISFDTPTSLKSYVQIKGRARKEDSKYYIFTDSNNYDETCQNKQIYDEMIRSTQEIAIKDISKRTVSIDLPKEQCTYKKVKTKSGALLNTHYALQLFMSYVSGYQQSNKAYFHFIETKGINCKCIIKLPQISRCSASYIVSDESSSKSDALKSAAFKAVKMLKKQGFLQDDFCPMRDHLLQRQLQNDKYDDLGFAKKSTQYMKILIQNTQIQVQKAPKTQRIINRFYFQTIKTCQLDFVNLNNKFKLHLPEFFSKPFKFQLFIIQFNNHSEMEYLKKKKNVNQIGILTCFPQQNIQQIFSQCAYKFQETQAQKFTFRRINLSLQLDQQEYKELQQVHNFLIAGCLGKQLLFYSRLAELNPISDNWKKINLAENGSYVPEQSRKYYPIVVLLKQDINPDKFIIDKDAIKKVKIHQQTFKKLYIYHNRVEKIYNDKFKQDFSDLISRNFEEIKRNKEEVLLQSIAKDNCFNKYTIIKWEQINQKIEQKMQNRNKTDLNNRLTKLKSMFKHTLNEMRNKIMNVRLWKDVRKQIIKKFLERNSQLKIKKQIERYSYFEEFLIYPISAQTLFKIVLVNKFVFKSLYDYTQAYIFRTEFLNDRTNLKVQQSYEFNSQKNLVITHAANIFNFIRKGTSKYLRELGNKFISNENEIQVLEEQSKGIESVNVSSINRTVIDEPSNNESNITFLKPIIEAQNIQFTNNSYTQIKYEQSQSQIAVANEIKFEKISISNIQKALTPRSYKSNNQDNYQKYQFIGDVILKLLATIQTFLSHSQVGQGELHIHRAQIICNANLHHKAILNKLFRYIYVQKQRIAPPYHLIFDDCIEKQSPQGITQVNQTTQAKGYYYIPGKVHADIIEALIGVLYLETHNLQNCQILLFKLGILQKPNLYIKMIKDELNQKIFEPYQRFQQIIGYKFKNKNLLIQSFTHPSFRITLDKVVEKNNNWSMFIEGKLDDSSLSLKSVEVPTNKVKVQNTFYQRFEFLGDSVLDLIVVEKIKYYNINEGDLSMLKQAAVGNKFLGLIALKLGIHDLILIDIPEIDELHQQFCKIRNDFERYFQDLSQLIKVKSIKLLGDVLQALIGALFIDNNFDYYITKNIVNNVMGKYIDRVIDKKDGKGLISPFNKFLKNNYGNYTIEWDLKEGTQKGLYKYKLYDENRNVIQECWEINKKKALEIMEEQHYSTHARKQ